MLVSKHAESKDLEKKCAVSIESKMLSGFDSKFTTGQEKDFAKLLALVAHTWPRLCVRLTFTGCIWFSKSRVIFSAYTSH
jgi:hypothetical protein